MQDAKKQWQFDILGFAEATPGYTLSLLGFYMLKSQGLISEFGLDEAKLCVYLRRIESGYDDTIPYHNRYGVPHNMQHIACFAPASTPTKNSLSVFMHGACSRLVSE